ncbi:hypothetical protein OEA41_009773 [Lepraria neglecta]|uniref:NADP-dependent oxidoreductase domain-containing protein n=1 Tax=Lepraria neglecta TaxID=209136 RepID=A0AAE0DH46_9LECA|nr:hypothetical protein OEA41_009773 [Lepraria neglecta]
MAFFSLRLQIARCGRQDDLDVFRRRYIDLYLVHIPIAAKYVDPTKRYPPGWSIDGESAKVITEPVSIQETCQAMGELVDAGIVKNIGVSNFQGVCRIADHRPSPLRPHPSLSPRNRTPSLLQQSLFDLCNEEKIAVTAYSSLGPSSFVELGMDKSIPPLIEDPKIVTIANKAPAQILLRWATQRGVAVIQKSNNHDWIVQNLDCCSFDLSEEEVKTISAYDRGLRFVNPAEICDPPVYIFE